MGLYCQLSHFFAKASDNGLFFSLGKYIKREVMRLIEQSTDKALGERIRKQLRGNARKRPDINIYVVTAC